MTPIQALAQAEVACDAADEACSRALAGLSPEEPDAYRRACEARHAAYTALERAMRAARV